MFILYSKCVHTILVDTLREVRSSAIPVRESLDRYSVIPS